MTTNHTVIQRNISFYRLKRGHQGWSINKYVIGNCSVAKWVPALKTFTSTSTLFRITVGDYTLFFVNKSLCSFKTEPLHSQGPEKITSLNLLLALLCWLNSTIFPHQSWTESKSTVPGPDVWWLQQSQPVLSCPPVGLTITGLGCVYRKWNISMDTIVTEVSLLGTRCGFSLSSIIFSWHSNWQVSHCWFSACSLIHALLSLQTTLCFQHVTYFLTTGGHLKKQHLAGDVISRKRTCIHAPGLLSLVTVNPFHLQGK